MYTDVEIKLKKKNKIIFSRDSACLQELLQLIRKQNHRTLVLWAFACTQEIIVELEKKYPHEQNAKKAYALCQQWAHGEVNMPIAKRAILACHGVCKQLDSDVDIALFHAVGQGLSTVHVETHAIGLAIYELSAIVFANRDNYESLVNKKIAYYIQTLLYFQEHCDEIEFQWAPFLLKDIQNKEAKLYNKQLLNK